ncbi:hypothetical protein [Caballeronia arationis]|jgi:hypothetical protein|nr:hypothetical protein [Caballeronia arationis]
MNSTTHNAHIAQMQPITIHVLIVFLPETAFSAARIGAHGSYIGGKRAFD